MPPKQSNIYRSGVAPVELQEESSSSSEDEMNEEESVIPLQTNINPTQDKRLQRLEAFKAEKDEEQDVRKILREKALKRRQEQEKEIHLIQNENIEEIQPRQSTATRAVQTKIEPELEEDSTSSEESSSEEEEEQFQRE